MQDLSNGVRKMESDAVNLINDLEGEELELNVLIEENELMKDALNPNFYEVEETKEDLHIRMARVVADKPKKIPVLQVPAPLTIAQRAKILDTMEEQQQQITDLLVAMSNDFMALTDDKVREEILANPQLKARLKSCYQFFKKNLAKANHRITLIEMDYLLE
jgi:hypothetical protein